MKNESFVEKFTSLFLSDRSKRRIGFKSRASQTPQSSKLRLEALESRELLAADLLNAVVFGPSPQVVASSEVVDDTPIPLEVQSEVSGFTVSNSANTLWVTSTADDALSPAPGTLRYAVDKANAGDTIKFDPNLKGATIKLDGENITISKNLTIDASDLYDKDTQTPGITIDADEKTQVFYIGGGNQTTAVTLNGLNIINGAVNFHAGAGVYVSKATVTLENTTISNSVNGIYALESTITASNVTLSKNSADGICALSNSTVTIDNSTISENEAYGIYAKGTSTITNVIVTGNVLEGINVNGTSTITNATVAGNKRDGIEARGTSTITNATVAGNGQYGVDAYGATVTVVNTIVATNRRGNVFGSLSDSSSNNLTSYFPGFVCGPIFDANGNLTNANNLDLSLRSDSPAIDAGLSEAIKGFQKDMNGKARVYGNTVDIGAYEYQGDRKDESFYSTLVTTSEDSFDLTDEEWSLREAIYYAPEYVTITFDKEKVTEPVVLKYGELLLNDALAIDGKDQNITINADQKSRVIYVADVGTEESPVVLNGLTIENGKTTENGGGIYSSGTLKITNTTVSNNYARSSGGGVWSSGTLTIENATISKNTADCKSGGGISLSGTATITSTEVLDNTAYYDGGGIEAAGVTTITDTMISGNKTTNGEGGGIYITDEVNITDSTIANNTTTYLGGGICLDSGTGYVAKVTLTNSTVTENKCKGMEGATNCHGGGIYSDNGSTITATGTTFSKNEAWHGGGIWAEGNLKLTNSIVSQNKTSATFGGVYAGKTFTAANVEISKNTAKYYGGLGVKGVATIINTTIAGNSASYECGGVYVNSAKPLSIKNSIVARNYNGNVAGTLQGALVYDESGRSIVGYNPGFVCDPIFSVEGELANADTVDLHLAGDSQAIDAGSNEDAAGIQTDLDGNPRVYDSNKVDVGAYEFQGVREKETTYPSSVTTLNDTFDPNDGEWSLREAIYYAREKQTIRFASDLQGSIVLELGELVIDKVLTIEGEGRITVDGNGKSRVFAVYGGTTGVPVALSGLKITNAGTDIKSENYQAGLYAGEGSVVTLTDVDVFGNLSMGACIDSYAKLTLTDSTVSQNGGIGLFSGHKSSTTLKHTSVTSNGSSGVYGNSSSSFDLQAINSDISGNEGEGIYAGKGTVTLTNSLVCGNGKYGIYTGGYATLKNTTVFGNGTEGVYAHSATVKLSNSIVVGNGTDFCDYQSYVTASNVLSSYTKWDSGDSCIVYDSDLPLFNDSEKGDFSLSYNSQALDKGNNSYVDVDTDYTGGTRITGKAVDLGACEYQIPLIDVVLSTEAPQLGVKISTEISPDNATASYRWFRVDSNDEAFEIEDATESSYTPTAADMGFKIRVQATGSNYSSGTKVATSSQYTVGSLSAVSITQNTEAPVVGALFTANVDPSLAVASFQWIRVDANGETIISGATEATYTATEDDFGSYLKVVVVGTDGWRGEFAAQTEAKVLKALTGVSLSTDAPKPGEAVTATLATSEEKATWQWYRVDANGDATEISGAIGASYTPTDDDSTYYLKVVATGNGDYALSVDATSTYLYVKPENVEIAKPTTETFTRAVLNVQDGGTIKFAENDEVQTISLTESLTIDKTLTIDGSDAKIVFDGGASIMPVAGPLSTTGNSQIATNRIDVAAKGTLTLKGVTFQNFSNTYGGAIYNAGTVTLNGVTFQYNKATKNGGAIFNTPDGTITIINDETTFLSNSATNGGSIANYGTTTIKSGATATFTSNSAGNFGGAYFGCGKLEIKGTANFTDNEVTESGSKGGAIYSDVYKYNADTTYIGTVEITGSATFSGNTAVSRGGALMIYGDAGTSQTLSIKPEGNNSVTFVKNQAEYGGAIDVGASANASFGGSVRFGSDGESSKGNCANYGGALYIAGAASFASDGKYEFYYNTASQSGGAINACNYKTTAGDGYVAGSLALSGTFTFGDNKANGSGTTGLGGAIATAEKTTTDGATFVWKNGNYAGRGKCVAVDTDVAKDKTLNFGEFPSGTGYYSTFLVIKEASALSSALLPTMFAANAVSATITVENETTTFGSEGVSPAQLGLGVGTYEALIEYADANGETSSTYSLVLTVDPDASLEVRETSIANGRGVKFNFNLTKEDGRAVSVWEIAWGDGTTTRYENLSSSWLAAHYYAKDGTFDVSLSVTYLDGTSETFEAFSTQKIGTTPVATTGNSELLAAVFTEVEDVFDELDEFVPYGPSPMNRR